MKNKEMSGATTTTPADHDTVTDSITSAVVRYGCITGRGSLDCPADWDTDRMTVILRHAFMTAIFQTGRSLGFPVSLGNIVVYAPKQQADGRNKYEFQIQILGNQEFVRLMHTDLSPLFDKLDEHVADFIDGLPECSSHANIELEFRCDCCGDRIYSGKWQTPVVPSCACGSEEREAA